MLVLLLMANALVCDLECVLNCQAQNEATTCGPLCGCPSTHEMFSLTVDSQTYLFPVLQETERLWAQQRFDCNIDSVTACRQAVTPAEQLQCLQATPCGSLLVGPAEPAKFANPEEPASFIESRWFPRLVGVLVFGIVFGSFSVGVMQSLQKQSSKDCIQLKTKR